MHYILGKEVKKMPILVNGQTIWADCVDIDHQDKNNLMLDLDLSTPTSNSSLTVKGKS